MLEWGTCPREAGPAGPRSSSPEERERNAVMAIRVGGSICCSSIRSPTHLSHSKTFSNPFEPFQIKWEVYFSKELCCSSLWCRWYDSACICICVCIVVHGYTTLPLTQVDPFKNYYWFENEFCLVWFYGILTIVGFLMPNPLYIYIYDFSTHFIDNIFKRTRVLFCTQLKGFTHFFEMITLMINHIDYFIIKFCQVWNYSGVF